MRKILALVMVFALATLLSGCRILGDYDDDGVTAGAGAAPTGNVTVTPVVLLPVGLAAAPAASIKGMVSVLDLTFTVNGTVLRVKSAVSDGTNWTVTFEAYTVPAGTAYTNNSASLTGTVDLGNGQTATVNFAVNNVATTQNQAVTNTVTVTVAGGTNTLAITVSTTNNTVGGTQSGTGSSTVSSAAVTLQDFYVKSVLCGTATLTASVDSTETIKDLTPDFVVALSKAFTPPTSYSFECVNLTDGNKTVTFTSPNQGVEVMATDNNTKITFHVFGTDQFKLEQGKTYKVTLKTALVDAADNTKTINNLVRYFKTSTTAVQ